tara:strand:- start:2399 stop:4042 length:1644 start_codon:yes stop_codon:yes gene_type:complete
MAIRQSPAARRARTIGDITDLLSEYLQGKTEERLAATKAATKEEEKKYVVTYTTASGETRKTLVPESRLMKDGGFVTKGPTPAKEEDKYKGWKQVTVTDKSGGTHVRLVPPEQLAAEGGVMTAPPEAPTQKARTVGQDYADLFESQFTEDTLRDFYDKSTEEERQRLLDVKIGLEKYEKAAPAKVAFEQATKEYFPALAEQPEEAKAPTVKTVKIGDEEVTVEWKDGKWKELVIDGAKARAPRWKKTEDKPSEHFKTLPDGRFQMYRLTETGAEAVGDPIGEKKKESLQLVQVLDEDTGDTVWVKEEDAVDKKVKKAKKPDKFWYYNPDTQEDEMHLEDAEGTEKMVPRGKVGVYTPVSREKAQAKIAQELKNKYKAEYDVMRQQLGPEWAWYTEAGNTQVKNADTSFNRWFDRELKGKDPNNVQSRIEAKKDAYGKLSTVQKQNYDRIEAIKEKEAMLIKAMYQRRLGIDESVENKIFVYTSIEDFVVDNPQLNSIPLEKIRKHIDEARVKWLKQESDVIIHIHDKVTAKKGFLAVLGEIMGFSGE